MMIDNSYDTEPMSKEEIVDNLKTMVFGVQAFERFNAKERETLDKAWNMIDQCENRLKADMIAMFTEIQASIRENINSYNHKMGWDTEWSDGADWCIDLIQARIDALEGKSNETNKKLDKYIKILELYNNGFTGYVGCFQETINVAIDTMRKYQQLQADYENLKANIVTMLEELDLQIDDTAAYNLEVAKVQRLIRDNIAKLKENEKWQ